MGKRRFFRFLTSTPVAFIFVLLVLGALGYAAWRFTEQNYVEPDFGANVTLRQTDIAADSTSFAGLRLSRSMIFNYLNRPEALRRAAEKCGWQAPVEELREYFDVRDNLIAQKSFVVTVNVGNAARSRLFAHALAEDFLEFYRQEWSRQMRAVLVKCNATIKEYKAELERLYVLQARFKDRGELQPLNNEIEMQALNDQLVEAQAKFLEAYGAYVNRMEEKRSAFQLEYDMARQVYSEDDPALRRMARQLAEINRQSDEIHRRLAQQRPDLYRLTVEPGKLTGLPNEVQFFYDNVQTLQQLKLSMMLKSIIEGKENMLETEQSTKNTIERLLESDSCDVFIREVSLR